MIEYQILDTLRINQVKSIKKLINKNISFGLASDQTVYNLIKNHQVYIATEGKQIIGVLTSITTHNHIEFKHLSVSENHKLQGVATNLLDLAIETSDKTLPIMSVCWTTSHGWETEKLLQSRGFIITEENMGYWEIACFPLSCPYHKQRCSCSSKIALRSPK